MLTYEETLDYLYHLEIERMDLKLERVAEALRRCGSPQQKFPTLHVAGTNGKGSTAAFLHSILSAAGYRVGLFTSPHLVDFCERIRLGKRQIFRSEVIDGVAEIRRVTETAGIHLTPFEVMTVLAFTAFAQAQVDIAVVEVGLGGRLDSTNVLTPLVSIITSIGLDHQQYLGPTIAHIAREKGGIIKTKTPVVLGGMDEESREILCGIAHERNCPLAVFERDFFIHERPGAGIDYQGRSWHLPDMQIGLRGRFQYGNAAVAVAALEEVQAFFPVSESHLRQGLRAATWPGRLEVVSEHPLVILDGAHNPQAMKVLCTELPRLLDGKQVTVLFGVMRDKDWQTMVPLIAERADRVVVTRVHQPRTEEPAALQQAFASLRPTRILTDARTACQRLIAETTADGALLVCGSLFLVGEVYPLFSPPTAGVSA